MRLSVCFAFACLILASNTAEAYTYPPCPTPPQERFEDSWSAFDSLTASLFRLHVRPNGGALSVSRIDGGFWFGSVSSSEYKDGILRLEIRKNGDANDLLVLTLVMTETCRGFAERLWGATGRGTTSPFFMVPMYGEDAKQPYFGDLYFVRGVHGVSNLIERLGKVVDQSVQKP